MSDTGNHETRDDKMNTATAIEELAKRIATGDLDDAREWATANAGALTQLRHNGAAQAVVAHACNRWGAPMVWPWGDRHQPTPAQQRALVAIRRGGKWMANEDTIAVLVAVGAVKTNPETGTLTAV